MSTGAVWRLSSALNTEPIGKSCHSGITGVMLNMGSPLQIIKKRDLDENVKLNCSLEQHGGIEKCDKENRRQRINEMRREGKGNER